MDKLVIKMIMGYAKFRGYWWFDTQDLQVDNPRLLGDDVVFDISYGNFKSVVIRINLLDLLAWVYSKNASI